MCWDGRVILEENFNIVEVINYIKLNYTGIMHKEIKWNDCGTIFFRINKNTDISNLRSINYYYRDNNLYLRMPLYTETEELIIEDIAKRFNATYINDKNRVW